MTVIWFVVFSGVIAISSRISAARMGDRGDREVFYF